MSKSQFVTSAPYRLLGVIAFYALILATSSSCKKNSADVAESSKIDLSGYHESAGMVVPSPPLINGQFDQGDKGWDLQTPFRVEAQGGLNQTGALFCEKAETSSKVFFAVQEVPLLKNVTYRLSAQVKTENCRGTYPAWNAATLAVYYYKDGKFVGGGGSPTSPEMEKPLAGTRDWTRREVMFTVPAGITSGKIQLFMTAEGAGKIWFDDIAITPETLPPTAFLVRPTADRFLPTDGSFAIRWDNLGLQKEAPSVSAWVRILADGKVVKSGIFPLQGALTMGQLGSLPEGSFTLEATLLDTKEKQILHRQSFPVTCKAATAGGPHAVRVDNRGRTFIGEKPFMPIGLFTLQFDPQMLDRIARSPFNTLLPYTSLTMEYPPEAVLGSGAPRPAVGPGYLPGVRAAMDACQERGLKFIYCIDSWPRTVAERELTPSPEGKIENKKLMELSATLVDSLKDHPALLAWYTADEPSPAVAPGLARFNHWLRQRDPSHPSYAVYMHFNDLAKFTASADIMGVDPYPIMDRKETMSVVDTAMRGAQSALGTVPGEGLPLWGTVQAHNVGLYTPGARVNKEILSKTNRLTPTEEDMRAMSLRMAIGGARGFIFFCYSDLLSPSVASEFEQRWADHCRVGELLRELQPFLYSDEKAPAITVKTLKGEVNAAAYQTADGKIRVLITGSGPGESEAEITVSGTDKLVSRFGNSEAMGDGSYRFKGTDICSDVLVGN
jgi:hypothetical protein